MARTVRNAKLETRAARERLASGSKPHWKTLIPGKLHLGYRRKANGQAGAWLVRHYLGGERYRVAPLGAADDLQPSDGATVLSYAEAQQKALSSGLKASEERTLTVEDAVMDYLTYLRAEKRTADDAELRARRHILPTFGKDKVANLTTARLIRWRDELANQPAMVRPRKGGEPQFRPAPATENERRARRATVNRTWTILRAALNRAWRHGHVPDKTAWERVKPFGDVHASRPGYLTVEEGQRLINAADVQSGFRDLVHGALLTGCRYSELAAMRIRNFHRSKIAITRSKTGSSRDVVLTEEGAIFFERLTAGRPQNALIFERVITGAGSEGGADRPKGVDRRP